jgi:hypothetical protein
MSLRRGGALGLIALGCSVLIGATAQAAPSATTSTGFGVLKVCVKGAKVKVWADGPEARQAQLGSRCTSWAVLDGLYELGYDQVNGTCDVVAESVHVRRHGMNRESEVLPVFTTVAPNAKTQVNFKLTCA